MTLLNDDTLSRLTFALGSEPIATDVYQAINAFPDGVVVDEVVTTTNAVENNLSVTIPAGAVILSVQANLNTLIAGDDSGDNLGVKVGIGTTASPVKYGVTASLLKNQKVNTIPSWAVLAGAEQICVKLVQAAGTAATEKFVAGGKVRVRVAYIKVVKNLPDALV